MDRFVGYSSSRNLKASWPVGWNASRSLTLRLFTAQATNTAMQMHCHDAPVPSAGDPFQLTVVKMTRGTSLKPTSQKCRWSKLLTYQEV